MYMISLGPDVSVFFVASVGYGRITVVSVGSVVTVAFSWFGRYSCFSWFGVALFASVVTVALFVSVASFDMLPL